MALGKLKQYFIGTLVSLTIMASGMSYGWSAPVIGRLMANDSIIPLTEAESSWIYGTIELGNMITPIPAGLLGGRYGRRFVLLSVAPLYIISWSLVVLTRSLAVLFLVRVMLGAAVGVTFAVCPLYIGEIAEPAIRGSLLSLISIFWYLGMCTSYCVGPFVSYNAMAAVQLTIPIIILLFAPFVPESPYFLLSINQRDLAYRSLEKLRGKRRDSLMEELSIIKECVELDKVGKLPWTALLTDAVKRKCLFMNCLISCVCFFSGLTVVFSYITKIFASAGGVQIDPDLCTIFIGFVFLFLACVNASVIDRFGRRSLLIFSSFGCGVSHVVSGAYFYLNTQTEIKVKDYSWILLVSLSSYCVFAVLGITTMLVVYQGEIFPNGIKSIAGGFITEVNSVSSLVSIKMFQVITSNFGMHASLWTCAFFCFSGCISFYLFILETKGKSLVEIQRELKGTRRDSMEYTVVNQENHLKSEMLAINYVESDTTH